MADPIFILTSTNPFGLSRESYPDFSFVDIDGDNDLDCFVGNIYGNLLFSQNTGTTSSPEFAAAIANPFGLSRVGAWASPAFADIDGDNDLDAFVGNEDGITRYFQNIGTASNPIFTAAIANPFGLSDVGFNASPALVDIDGDGDLDAFVGQYRGSIFFSRNIGTASSPIFAAAISNPFGLSNVGGYATPNFADIDDDGDLDAFVGHYEGSTFFYRNIGIATNPVFYRVGANPFGLSDVGRYSNPAFADIDDDGDLDVFNGNKVFFFQNTGVGSIPNFSHGGLSLDDVGRYASPAFVDIDGDNDLDAFVGNKDGNTLFFQNTGTASGPIFAAAISNPFGLSNVGGYATPNFADIDDDGDLDAFVGDYDGNTLFFQNTGTASDPIFATAISNPFGLSDVGRYAKPKLADIDGDGDLDAFVGTLFFQNNGTASNPVFVTPIANNSFGLNAVDSFVDIDGDGDLDAFLGTSADIVFYENTGTASSPQFAGAITNTFGFSEMGYYKVTPTFVDIDNDGDLDAAVGRSGDTIIFINNNAPNVTIDPA